MAIKIKLLLEPKDIKPSFIKWEIHGVLNPGGIRLKNKDIVLYVRVAEKPIATNREVKKCPVIVSEKKYKAAYHIFQEDRIVSKDGRLIFLDTGECFLTDISHFRRVFLDESGFHLKKIENTPLFTGEPGKSEYGVEDPRITKIGNRYYMTYVSVSRRGVSTSLAISTDLLQWKRRGIIFQEQNKDVVLFPEKIKGRYVALNRPESTFVFARSGIWISYSPDLIYWGKEKDLLGTRRNSWESDRNGSGPPPIKTKKGWLLIYHGLKGRKGKNIYSVGAVLLDLKNPEKILARSPMNQPIIKPNQRFEKSDLGHQVVFPTTAIPDLNGRDLLIYSGGGDRIVSVRKISLKYILKSMNYYQ